MASSSSSSHATPASSSRSYKYNVFLSFRGEDTRKTFVDHLYSKLGHHLITTYKDDEALPRGEYIDSSLFKAIEESQIVIIIFSKNYADSSWCLDELVHIMKCKEERELTVIPVFYHVTPSDVRKQNGDFEKAFAKQEVKNNNKAQLWRSALVSACNISGWHIADGHESKDIKEIAESILDKLVPINAYVDEDYVGMKTRMQEFVSQLEIGSEGVRMVGIWGLGGSGKTTLATSVYMEICHQYHGHCILENVRKESTKVGLDKLQEKMLSDIFKIKVSVGSVVEGIHKIRTMLRSRKVLIILDDVDNDDQLDALARLHSWFGSGSRIIITTRNEHLLKSHRVDVFRVKLLSPDESFKLFNRHAYNEKDPIEDYEALSLSVISYAARLPLALKVLGSFLYDRDKKGWMSTLNRLKDNGERDIWDNLRISYDGLIPEEKEIFLDIACFWRGSPKGAIVKTLEACGFHSEIGIQVLIQKALIIITRFGTIDMHDLIEEMGHHIVKEKYPYNPEKRSRVWKDKDIIDICSGNATKENDKIKAICFDHREQGPDNTSEFYKFVSNMTKLRYLRVCMIHPVYVEGPISLSEELRCIDWYGYPVTSPLPESLPKKLVELKLGGSLQEEIWNGYKRLQHLKVLELRNMKKLLSTPDFDGLPCLQSFSLYSCSELKEIHPSLGNHTSIEHIDIHECEKLKMFPTITQMDNLKSLEIECCLGILEFPQIQVNMKSLVNLSLEKIGIEVLPTSIGERCTNLVSLNLLYLHKLKSIEFNFDALKSIQEFTLKGSSLQLEKTKLPLFHQFLHSYQKLDMGECCLKDVEIPPGIIQVSDNDFSQTQLPPPVPRPVKLHGFGGRFILSDPESELPSSVTTHYDCKWLCKVSLKVNVIINAGESPLVSLHDVCMAIEDHYMLIQLTGTDVAKRFTPRMLRGSRGTLQLPENWSNNFSGFLMCAVLPNDYSRMSLRISVYEEMGGTDSEHDVFWMESGSDSLEKRTWVSYVSFASLRQTLWWDETPKALLFDAGDICCGFRVRLVEKKSRSGLTNASSGCKPKFKIEDDSASTLKISFKFP